MNQMAIHNLNIFLGVSAIILQILVLIVLFLLFIRSKKSSFLKFIEKNFLIIGFLLSLFATLFSLVYSEIIGYTPCHLCWFQRIFLFPQVFLFAIALWDKDRRVIRYSLPLLSVGFIIAIYQNFIYYFASNPFACDLSGVSCSQRLVSEFGGYISIPMLSLTSFIALLVVLLTAHFYKNKNLDL